MAPVRQARQAVGDGQGCQLAVGVFQLFRALGNAPFETVMQPGAGDRDHRLCAEHAQERHALFRERGFGQPVLEVQDAVDLAAVPYRQAHDGARQVQLHVRVGGKARSARDTVFDHLGAGADDVAQQ